MVSYSYLEIEKYQEKSKINYVVKYKNIIIRDPLFLDVLVENKIILEIKATELDHPVYESQLLTYLRLSSMQLGLLLNFGKKHLKDGIHRVINGF